MQPTTVSVEGKGRKARSYRQNKESSASENEMRCDTHNMKNLNRAHSKSTRKEASVNMQPVARIRFTYHVTYSKRIAVHVQTINTAT